MRLITIISVFISLASYSMADGPEFFHKDPIVYQEFENVYQDLRKRTFVLPSYTIAQFSSLVPRSVGAIYYCSDCTVDAVVVSTGTTISSFSRVSSRTTAIQ